MFFGELSKALEELEPGTVEYRILFLDAADDELVNRYEATRRRHPLAPADRVVEGIRKERLMMESLRGEADLVIDTTGLTPHELRERIRDAFAEAPPEDGLKVSADLVRLQVRRAAGRGPRCSTSASCPTRTGSTSCGR